MLPIWRGKWHVEKGKKVRADWQKEGGRKGGGGGGKVHLPKHHACLTLEVTEVQRRQQTKLELLVLTSSSYQPYGF